MSVKDEQALQIAVNAALNGPDKKDIEFDRHEWNIDKAKVTRNGLLVTVDGSRDGDNISHRRSWAKDDQVYYKFTIRVGQSYISLEEIDMNIKSGGFWATFIPVVKWFVEHWDEIVEIFKKLGGDEGIGTSVAQLRNRADFTQQTDQILDGTWEAEAQFLILNIALVAAGRALAEQNPNWLTELTAIGEAAAGQLVSVGDMRNSNIAPPPGSLVVAPASFLNAN